MKLYSWTVEWGVIVVVASSLEEARLLAKTGYDTEYDEPDQVQEPPCVLVWLE